nr:PD-(D/E)XK nuclease family protein [Candidatus Enterousia merdequi]
MLNNNIYCVSDPTHILDALWEMIAIYKNDFSRVLVFLPSRRAIRSVEKMIVDKVGHATVLPNLIPLGDGVDSEEDLPDTISNQERIIILSKLLSADANVKNIATALPLARDFIRMQDYLENEGIKITDINWSELIDEKYANHFQNKARILDILKQLSNDKLTSTQKRNIDIRSWKNYLNNYDCVIVCGSTGSVPATADLMYDIANNKNGKIILSGKISGRPEDFELDTNPYNSEYKFLKRLNICPEQVKVLDVGKNITMDIMNIAFGNSGQHKDYVLQNCKLLECNRESEEAVAAVYITKRALEQNKTVLIITPDAAGNQRIKSEMLRENIDVDFSSGISGTMTDVGRSILNLFDFWIENDKSEFEKLYEKNNYNLFKMLVNFIDENQNYNFQPGFAIDDEKNVSIFESIKNMSEILCDNNIVLNIFDARAFVSDAISNVVIRPVKNDDCKVCVLGTIESRMQTADVIILTGLNEGMFPATGYENAWLPRSVANKIGLPSPNRKVSLMALDFMTLSCAKEVYWLRSKQSGGVLMSESRFLSRVFVTTGNIIQEKDILESVRKINDVKYEPLDYSAPMPPIDKTDVYVTEIELLIHNPYAFYVKHILRLKKQDDYWVLPDARNFGDIVHKVIEDAKGYSSEKLIQQMDELAKQKLPNNSILFYFWHKRFCEIAPFIEDYFKNKQDVYKEINGSVILAGRNVRARADMIIDGIVADIKTGTVPTKQQLIDGTMPQIPLEGFIMQSGGFPIKKKNVSLTPILQFLQLKKGEVRLIEYKDEEAQTMIDNTVQKVKELFGQYGQLSEYEYRESVGPKYHEFDDLARVDD